MKKQQLTMQSMMKMMKTVVALLSVWCAVIAAPFAYGQTNVVAPPGVTEQISFDINPENPRPNEKVDIRVQSFSFNMNKAYVIWSVNGVVKLEGPGETAFNFTTGAAGTVQKVVIDITTEDLRSITKTVTFAPAKVGLVIEADTYTPPFYKGKALFTPQSNLKVVAFPELVTEAGYKIPSENLIYTWRVDGKVIQASSGYGRNSFTMEGSIIPRPIVVTAEVSAYNSALKAEESIEVEVAEPEIVLYEDNLLYGVQRQNGYTAQAFLYSLKEARFLAEPYFLSVAIPESADLRYVWTLNGQPVTSLNKPNMIGLENRTGEAGAATLGLSIEHLRKLLQAPSVATRLHFGDI